MKKGWELYRVLTDFTYNNSKLVIDETHCIQGGKASLGVGHTIFPCLMPPLVKKIYFLCSNENSTTEVTKVKSMTQNLYSDGLQSQSLNNGSICVSGKPYGDDNNDLYSNVEYEDVDGGEDVNEEENVIMVLPKFQTESQNLMVNEGGIIRLPCIVNRLGKTFIFVY